MRLLPQDLSHEWMERVIRNRLRHQAPVSLDPRKRSFDRWISYLCGLRREPIGLTAASAPVWSFPGLIGATGVLIYVVWGAIHWYRHENWQAIKSILFGALLAGVVSLVSRWTFCYLVRRAVAPVEVDRLISCVSDPTTRQWLELMRATLWLRIPEEDVQAEVRTALRALGEATSQLSVVTSTDSASARRRAIQAELEAHLAALREGFAAFDTAAPDPSAGALLIQTAQRVAQAASLAAVAKVAPVNRS